MESVIELDWLLRSSHQHHLTFGRIEFHLKEGGGGGGRGSAVEGKGGGGGRRGG